MKMKKHGLWMILCCVLPLLLIALLPGLRGGFLRFLPLILCVGMHLFMMKRMHGSHGTHKNHECDDTATTPGIMGNKEDN